MGVIGRHYYQRIVFTRHLHCCLHRVTHSNGLVEGAEGSVAMVTMIDSSTLFFKHNGSCYNAGKSSQVVNIRKGNNWGSGRRGVQVGACKAKQIPLKS